MILTSLILPKYLCKSNKFWNFFVCIQHFNMYGIQTYFDDIKKELASINELKSVHIVIGNESCDLDSMVSALALAFNYKSTIYKDGSTNVFPIMNIVAKDFPLRTENNYILKKNNVKLHNLLFLDTINLEDLCLRKVLKVTLVDHHVLPEKNKYLENCVVEIFDHRPLDTSVKWGPNVQMNIQQVGSCCSIICSIVLKSKLCMCCIAHLLYETIVFDTIGFKEEAGKAKDLDYKMADELEKVINPTEPRALLYKELWAAHNDISHLNSNELLYKDLKIVDKVYIPGLPMLVKKYLVRTDAIKAIFDFYNELNSDVLVLMGLEADAVVLRDIAVYCPDENNPLFTIICEKLVSNEDLALENVKVDVDNIVYYKQNNIVCSRKQVIPIIKECIQIVKH